MVTEPEAAAIYTLKGMLEGYNKAEINVGDVFVLCDAGGGTVDLISYKITQVQPTFRIEEAAIGSGDKCGATYVDRVCPSTATRPNAPNFKTDRTFHDRNSSPGSR